jgi:hypothetical protein
MRTDVVWEGRNEEGCNGWQLVEITCPWAWIDHDGETLEKAYKKKLGKYDQLRGLFKYGGQSDHDGCQCHGSFMKKSLAEFAKVTKLEGKKLARWSRDVVDAAIRGSYDIYTESMARVKLNRENPPDSAVIKISEEREVDCEVGEDKETEMRS